MVLLHNMFFFLSGFSFTDTDDSQGSSSTSTRSRTFRHLFATLHVRWLSRIFNRNACIYQTATRWDVPPYRITIWLIDNVTLSFCLFTWWFDSCFFCYSNLRQETGGFERASTITLVLQANRLIFKIFEMTLNRQKFYENFYFKFIQKMRKRLQVCI